MRLKKKKCNSVILVQYFTFVFNVLMSHKRLERNSKIVLQAVTTLKSPIKSILIYISYI